MGILKNASESILKYGEIIVNKTEEYTKIAKLNIDIKKMQSDIASAEKEIGQLVISKINSGSNQIDYKDPELKKLYDSIKKLNEEIEVKRAEIEKIKQEKSEEKEKRNSAAESKKTKKPSPEVKPEKTAAGTNAESSDKTEPSGSEEKNEG